MRRRSIGPSISFFAFQDIITAVVGIFILITLILVLELTQRVESASRPATQDVEQIVRSIELLDRETVRLSGQYANRIKEQTASSDSNEFNREARRTELEQSIAAAQGQLASLQEHIDQTRSSLESAGKMESKLLIESKALAGDRDEIADINAEVDALERSIDRVKSDDGLIYRDKTDDSRFVCILQLDRLGIELKDAESRTVRQLATPLDLEAWLRRVNVRTRHFLLVVKPSGVLLFDQTRAALNDANCVFGFDVVGPGYQSQLGFEWEPQP